MDPQSMANAFAVWAGVVFMVGVAIVWELSRLRAEVRTMATLLNAHQIEVQGRLTAVETHLHFRDGYVAGHRRGKGD